MIKLILILRFFGIIILASSLLEALILKFVVKRHYDWRSSIASFALLLGRGFTDLVPIAIAMPGAYWLYEHRLLEPAKYGAWSYVLLFFSLELVYYGWRRISHRSRCWDSSLGLFSRRTESGISVLSSRGLDSQARAARRDFQHAVRASRASCGERMFGSYRAERDDVRIRYGLVKPLHGYNPLRSARAKCRVFCSGRRAGARTAAARPLEDLRRRLAADAAD